MTDVAREMASVGVDRPDAACLPTPVGQDGHKVAALQGVVHEEVWQQLDTKATQGCGE